VYYNNIESIMRNRFLLKTFLILFGLSLVTDTVAELNNKVLPQVTRTIDAIVSSQWMEDNLNNPDLVILDVREPDFYSAGHIPGSVNVPATNNFFTCLLDPTCGLRMEVPSDDSLFKTIGRAGISANSTVVIVARSVESSTFLGPAEFGITVDKGCHNTYLCRD
jgi:hypothetical protein